MHRQIAGKLTGRVTKWIVLGAWIVIFVVAGGLVRQADRRPEQRGVLLAARERRVHQGARGALQHRRPQRDPHPGRLPPRQRADRRRLRGDGRAGRRDLPDRRRDRRGGAVPQRRAAAGRPGPARLRRRPGRLPLLHLQLRRERLERHPARGRGRARDRPDRRRHGPPRRLRRPGRRLRRGVRGHRHQPDPGHPPGGDRDPAAHLPQPDPLDPADRRRRLLLRDLGRRGLPAGQVRRPDRQRARARRSWASW